MITFKELRKLIKEAKKEGVSDDAIVLIDSNKGEKVLNTIENGYEFYTTNDVPTLIFFFDKLK